MCSLPPFFIEPPSWYEIQPRRDQEAGAWSTGAPRDAADLGGLGWELPVLPLPTSLAGRGLFPVPLGSLGSREPQNRSVHGFLPEFGGSWVEGEYEVTADENVSISNSSPVVF